MERERLRCLRLRLPLGVDDSPIISISESESERSCERSLDEETKYGQLCCLVDIGAND